MNDTEVLAGLSQGFTVTSDNLKYSLIIFISIISLLFIVYYIIKYYNTKELNLILKKKYYELLQFYNINSEERILLDKLSLFLDKKQKKYLLLSNSGVFHSTLNKLRQKEHLNTQIIEKLKAKLGFTNISEYSKISTTYDLPDKMPVYLMIGKGVKLQGKILKSEDFLMIEIEKNIQIYDSNTLIVLYLYTHTGLYSCVLNLIKVSDNVLFFKHTDKIQNKQRRDSFRKDVHFVVFLNSNTAGAPSVEAAMNNLSTTGAKITNPGKRFKSGDDIKLSFSDSQVHNIQLDATVVRTSKIDSILHVKFSHLKPAKEDEIVHILYKS